ncbi:MAG: hypothetical protein EPO21_20745 [Chloroflexota bacterium]|nr:MAG: hypothetical protein EPO21_20745 [Chloroflexota bacterium]
MNSRQTTEVAEQILTLIEGTAALPPFRELIFSHLRKPGKILDGEHGFRWGLLPLLCAQACGEDWRQAVPVGAAVEFFIAAGDVLDDLADLDTVESCSRDGRPHLSNAAAALLMLTQEAILRLLEHQVDPDRVLSISRTFAQAGIDASSGQYLDMEYERTDTLTIDECLTMVALKSGSLADCACRSGALVATADPVLITACAEFGRNLGIASQLRNDIDGLWTEELSKSDVPRRKKTLPVVYALRCATGQDAEALRRVYQSTTELTADQISSVRDILWRLGAKYYTSAVVDIHRQRARSALDVIPASDGRDALLALAASS